MPPCQPVMLACGHVLGATCFSKHIERTDDLLCPYCRQDIGMRRLIYLPDDSPYGRHLRAVGESPWYQDQEKYWLDIGKQKKPTDRLCPIDQISSILPKYGTRIPGASVYSIWREQNQLASKVCTIFQLFSMIAVMKVLIFLCNPLVVRISDNLIQSCLEEGYPHLGIEFLGVFGMALRWVFFLSLALWAPAGEDLNRVHKTILTSYEMFAWLMVISQLVGLWAGVCIVLGICFVQWGQFASVSWRIIKRANERVLPFPFEQPVSD